MQTYRHEDIVPTKGSQWHRDNNRARRSAFEPEETARPIQRRCAELRTAEEMKCNRDMSTSGPPAIVEDCNYAAAQGAGGLNC